MDEKRDDAKKKIADENLEKVAGGVQGEGGTDNSLWLNSNKKKSNGADGENAGKGNMWEGWNMGF